MRSLFVFLIIIISLISCEQHHGGYHKTNSPSPDIHEIKHLKQDSVVHFPTVGYLKVYEQSIPFSIEKVFPLFEPSGRNLLYENWNPEVLKEGKSGSLKGMVLFSKYDNLDVMLTVRDYNPKDGYIQYLVIWDDFEIQRIDIFCTAINNTTTKVKWVEHNAGLYEKGIPLVKMFVEEGYLVKVVQRYIENIEKRLYNEQ